MKGESKSSSSGSKAPVSHCAACKANSSDVKFALLEKLPAAVPGQCSDCYNVLAPTANIVNWSDFCSLMQDPGFAGRVAAQKAANAAKQPSALAGHHDAHDLQVTQRSAVQVRVIRKGKLLQRKHRQFNGRRFTAKQLKLKHAVKLQHGKFVAAGHIVSMPNQELEVEVSCTLDVATQSTIMNLNALQDDLLTNAIEKAFASGDWNQHEQGKPFLALMRGSVPSLDDIAQRAERVGQVTAKRKVKSAVAEPDSEDNDVSDDGEGDKDSSSSSGGEGDNDKSDGSDNSDGGEDSEAAPAEAPAVPTHASTTPKAMKRSHSTEIIGDVGVSPSPKKQVPDKDKAAKIDKEEQEQSPQPTPRAGMTIGSFVVNIKDGMQFRCVSQRPRRSCLTRIRTHSKLRVFRAQPAQLLRARRARAQLAQRSRPNP